MWHVQYNVSNAHKDAVDTVIADEANLFKKIQA